jgi:hypothetical protein
MSNDHVGAAEVARMLGTCLIQSGDLERAEGYLNTARDFYHRTEMRPYLVRTLSSLTQLLEQQNRHVEAHSVQAEMETLTKALTLDERWASS